MTDQLAPAEQEPQARGDAHERLLTIDEVARTLGVDATTVRRWAKNGTLEAIELPHRGRWRAYRIKASVLARLVGDSPTEERYLTVRQVACQLRVDETTVRRWIVAEVLSAVILPHAGKRCAYRIKESVLNAVLQANRLLYTGS